MTGTRGPSPSCGRNFLWAGCLICLLPWGLASAQRFRLQDGRVLDGAAVVIKEGRLVQTVVAGGGQAERSWPVSKVVEIEGSEPDAIVKARAALELGRPAEALIEADPVVRQFAPFPSTLGSWWLEAQVITARAQASLGREEAVRASLAALRAAKPTPRQAAWISLIQAIAQSRAGDPDSARALLEPLVRDGNFPDVEREACLLLGELALAAGDWEQALDSFLRLPAFHGHRVELLPRALLGAARAYRGLKDPDRMERTLFTLLESHGSSAEAAAARREFPGLSSGGQPRP